MAVNGVYQSGAQNASAAAAARTKLAGDMDTFLTMLTTQLKNQDPLSPMDSTQFTSQLVQFASVEQQISSNKNLEQLVSLMSLNRTSTALNYIGSEVTAESAYLPLQDGKGQFTYILPSDVDKLTVGVYDSKGKLLRTFEEPAMTEGSHSITWDGKDDKGEVLADGAYIVHVFGTDTDGEPVAGLTAVTGKVTGVSSRGDDVMLSMGDVEVPMESVLTFRSQPKQTAAAE